MKALRTHLSLSNPLSCCVCAGPKVIQSLPRHIITALFTGEQWGYVGSRMFASDITNFKCDQVWSERAYFVRVCVGLCVGLLLGCNCCEWHVCACALSRSFRCCQLSHHFSSQSAPQDFLSCCTVIVVSVKLPAGLSVSAPVGRCKEIFSLVFLL